MLRQYYTDSPAEQLLTKPGVLAVVAYGDRCQVPTAVGTIPVGLNSLSGKHFEIIEHYPLLAKRGIDDLCHWSYIDDLMCIATWIEPDNCALMCSEAEAAYLRLLRCSQQAGFPHLLRMWNFIPDINLGDGDGEIYKQFCIGRQNAFDELKLDKAQYPAASALGHHTRGGVIYMLASRTAGKHHENPRQQPAYHYPRNYGPSSPSFARATTIGSKDTEQIFISGTASILGHDTQAAGDLAQQLEITVDNIRCLQQSVSSSANQFSAIRVYLRHKRDYHAALAYLNAHFPETEMNFVHADICRDNLLVEIEALASPSNSQCNR